MKKKSQLVFALAMFGLAAYFTLSFWRNSRDDVPKVYFYDLSERKLFTAPQDAVPPIIGIDGTVADGVRAIVYSPSGDCDNDQKIAYLEKYSPELKAQFELAKKDPGADIPRMSRAEAQNYTFVSRVGETTWHPMNSEEAGRIIGEWRLAHPGSDPVICIP